MVLFPRNAQQRRQTILLTALGVGSGVMEYVVTLLGIDPTEPNISPGVIFGTTLAVYLFFARRINPVRGLGLTIASVVSWVVPLLFASQLFDELKGDASSFFIVGLSAGFIGSGLLIISLSVLFGYFPSQRLRAITVMACALLGGLLLYLWPVALGETYSFLALFAVWQGAFAYCFSLALIEEDERHGLPKADI